MNDSKTWAILIFYQIAVLKEKWELTVIIPARIHLLSPGIAASLAERTEASLLGQQLNSHSGKIWIKNVI